MHASVNRVIIGSGNGLSPVRRQDITVLDLLSAAPLGKHYSEIRNTKPLFQEMHLKMSSGKCRAFCSDLKQPQDLHVIGSRSEPLQTAGSIICVTSWRSAKNASLHGRYFTVNKTSTQQTMWRFAIWKHLRTGSSYPSCVQCTRE